MPALGKTINDETRARMQDAQRSRWADSKKRAQHREIMNRPDVVEKMRKSHLGIPHFQSLATKSKIRAALTNADVRAKISVAGKGRVCSEEHKKQISLANKGSKRTIETKTKMSVAAKMPEARAWLQTDIGRAKLSAAVKLAYLKNPKLREMRALAYARYFEQWPNQKTSLEYSLARYLVSLGVDFIEQKRFGRYIVDAYVPSLNIAYEADGSYWHQDKQREYSRDTYLRRMGISAVIHLGEKELNI